LVLQTHASKTEDFLEKNPDISNSQTLQDALNILDTEVTPDINPPEADPKYRKGLAKSLVYKVCIFSFKAA